MTRQQRIAILLPDLRGGGAERMMVNLGNEIARRGYHIDLVLGRAEGPYLSSVAEAVNVVELDAYRPPGYSAAGMLPGLIRYFRRRRPVAALSVLTRLNIIAITATRLANVGTRIVVSERNHLSTRVERADQYRMKALPVLARLSYPYADGIVAISNGVADDLAESARIARERIDVIYNPAYSDDIDTLAEADCPHPWFESDDPVLLGVGGLSDQKDFATLIRAFARVREDRPVRLIILGEGDNREQLESLVRRLDLEDQVDLPGFVDNPFAYMSRASLFVLSSAWEGFGNVIVEAMACGTPIVSTDCPSGPSEILEYGKYGVLVPVGDEETMANAIRNQLDATTDTESLRERAKDFTVETIANQYLDVLLYD